MKKSRMYELAISAVIDSDQFAMDDKIVILKRLFDDRDLSLYTEAQNKEAKE